MRSSDWHEYSCECIEVAQIQAKLQLQESYRDRKWDDFIDYGGYVCDQPAIPVFYPWDQSDERYCETGIGCVVENTYQSLSVLRFGSWEILDRSHAQIPK